MWHFILTGGYYQLQNHKNSLFRDDDFYPVIVLKGSKGVGKSTSLYALAIEMATEKHHDSNHPRILYFSANTLKKLSS